MKDKLLALSEFVTEMARDGCHPSVELSPYHGYPHQPGVTVRFSRDHRACMQSWSCHVDYDELSYHLFRQVLATVQRIYAEENQ